MDEKERLKARQAFVDRHKHELAGLILDGSAGRTGAEYALWARTIMHKIDQKLGKVFDDLLPEPPKPIPPLSEADKAKLAAEAKKPPGK